MAWMVNSLMLLEHVPKLVYTLTGWRADLIGMLMRSWGTTISCN